MSKPNWIEEFKEDFCFEDGDELHWSSDHGPVPWDVITFISELLSSEREEKERQLKKRVGQLRQWLNEDRITYLNKMVTNDDIMVWLKEKE